MLEPLPAVDDKVGKLTRYLHSALFAPRLTIPDAGAARRLLDLGGPVARLLQAADAQLCGGSAAAILDAQGGLPAGPLHRLHSGAHDVDAALLQAAQRGAVLRFFASSA